MNANSFKIGLGEALKWNPGRREYALDQIIRQFGIDLGLFLRTAGEP